jgi:hypothetical protein
VFPVRYELSCIYSLEEIQSLKGSYETSNFLQFVCGLTVVSGTKRKGLKMVEINSCTDVNETHVSFIDQFNCVDN